jgi:HD-like signal output (HDOD) protein
MQGKAVTGAMRLWVDKACEKELPVLAATLGQIEKALTSDEYSTFALARVILQDPPLTTKVLRVANSAYYNPSGQSISMVSRAVLILGFDAVRAICTSIAVIDALLRGAVRTRLLDEIARSLYAAVIARHLATHRHDPAPEEVFVATLLGRLGHMVFWSLDEPEAEALDAELAGHEDNADAIETRRLGFRLSDLSEPLADLWGLPLRMANKAAPPESRTHLQETARQVAEHAAGGWESPQMVRVVREVAWFLSTSTPEAQATLRALARETAQVAQALGSMEVARRVPGQDPSAVAWEAESGLSTLGEVDQGAELRVLHEISANLLDGLDVNSVFEMVLEGIHRGVGMDRTALALLDPRSGEVRCKMALGVHRRALLEGFRFAVEDSRRHVLAEAMAKCRSVLVDPKAMENAGMIDHPIYALFEGRPFLAQVVAVRGRAVGMFLADRHSTRREVDREIWDNFRLLVRQADIALALAAGGKG